ncbi:MAG: ATP-binding protein [Pseudomonadota bacterium]
MGFSFSRFLAENRETIVPEWVDRLMRVGDRYPARPRKELLSTISEAYDANTQALLKDDYTAINRFIDKIIRLRLDDGFLLSDVQMAFELFRSISLPLLATVTTAAELTAAVIKINRCMTHTIHRFSDRFQAMHHTKILEHNRQLTEEVRRRTAALKESELKYKVLVEEINDGYIVIQDNLVVFANPAFCKMHGYPSSEVLGRDFSLFIDPESRERVVARYHRSLTRQDPPRTFEYLRLTRRGQSYPTEILAKTTIYDNKLSSLGICRDITDRVLMEKKVRESERMAYIGQIATSLSHEIRNPLSSVQMNLQILKKNPNIQGNDQRRIDISVQEVKRLEHILKELLDFAKPIQLQLRRESLGQIISESVELLEMKFREQQVDIQTALDPLVPAVYADREKLGQALINLLLNGLEASAPGGRITIESRFLYHRDQHVQIVVSDEGCGLPDAGPEEIFKPFFTTKSKGTGLGLSNVRRIVEAHKGTIHAKARDPQGAVFSILLPHYGS